MLLAGAEMARAVVTENVLTRVFALRFGSELVSGFAIELDERQYLVTARHALSASVSTGTVEVLQNKSWVQLSFRRLQVEPQEVDIAILVLDRKLTSAPPIRLGERGTILSQGVYFVGFPYGLSIEAHAVNSGFPIPLVKHGIIAALHTGTLGQPFLVDGINNPGFSGGPVVRDDREMIPTIIGVVSGYQASQEPVYRQKLKTELTVEVNTGLLVAYPIDYAVEAIKKDPSGYHVGAQP
jgi:S1-C subfamily serine protease